MPSTRTLTSMGLSGLAKLSCAPAQHTGMLVVLSSVGGAVVIGGTSGCGSEEREWVSATDCGTHNCDQDSHGTWSRVDRGLLVPTELVANTLTV